MEIPVKSQQAAPSREYPSRGAWKRRRHHQDRIGRLWRSGNGSSQQCPFGFLGHGPTKIVAMADVVQSKLDRSLKGLSQKHKDKVDVPPERRHIGFDGYRKAMDALDPGDVVIFTSPCAFRWVHYEYAIKKNLNVFMEKPVTPDGFSSRKMLELNEKAKKKNLKVGVGLMCRHSQARRELMTGSRMVKSGNPQLEGVSDARTHRFLFLGKNTTDDSDLIHQIKNFHSFLWLSGGSFSDFFIHNIDECCWMKDAWPVKAQAQGGRHYRGDKIDQNFDNYTVEYTFPDETRCISTVGIWPVAIRSSRATPMERKATP